MNGFGNLSYYALSASFIGDFLKSGGCDLGTGKMSGFNVTWNGGEVIVGEYIVPCMDEKGNMQHCSYNIDASPLCTDQIDECMVADIKYMVEGKEETWIEDTDKTRCAKTWSQLFLVSGKSSKSSPNPH